MKSLVFLALILIAIAAATFDLLGPPETNLTDKAREDIQLDAAKPAPAVIAPSLTSEDKISLSDLDEDVVLLNFWASWCSICLDEFPDMFDLAKKSGGRIAILAVSIDDRREDAENFYATMKAKYGTTTPGVYWAWDKDKLVSLNTFNTIRVPETIIIDKNRQMVGKIVGAADWKSPEIRAFIQQLVK